MTKTLLFVLIAILMLTFGLASAEQMTSDARTISPKEAAAFKTFYLKRNPNENVIASEFSVTRPHGDKRWTVKASVFTLPERGYKNLCKLDEYRYLYDEHNAWREDDGQGLIHYVWLDEGKDCSKPAKRIVLNLPLPDIDVIELLTHANAVLKQAAIMLRGNTECSLVHVGGLQLSGIGTGLFHHETMLEFDYAGDAHDRASLLARKLGPDLTTWDIHCTTS